MIESGATPFLFTIDIQWGKMSRALAPRLLASRAAAQEARPSLQVPVAPAQEEGCASSPGIEVGHRG